MKSDYSGKKWKNTVEITTGRISSRRERTFFFHTDQDSVLDYFRQRRGLSAYDFPRYVEGETEWHTDSGGGGTYTWKDFDSSWFGELLATNIYSIYINGKDINESIIEVAEKNGAQAKFLTLYYVQFIFDKNPDWIFNWYPTTGTLSKQKATEKFYRMKNLGIFAKVEDALLACK